MKRKLDLLVNTSILLLCLTVSSLLIKKHFFPPSPPERPRATSAGEFLDLPGALTLGQDEVVVMAALAPACGFCEESMPFYRALSDRINAEGTNLSFVAAVRDAEVAELERRTLDDAGVAVDQVIVADFDSLGVPGTPMLIVANPDGEVLGAWLGKLGKGQELEVFEMLGLGGTGHQGQASRGAAVVEAEAGSG